jgi:hypothetical protein
MLVHFLFSCSSLILKTVLYNTGKRLFISLKHDSEVLADESYKLLKFHIKIRMKENEIIQIAVMVALAAALIYFKYRKKKKTGELPDHKMPGKSQAAEEEYEPYSKSKNNK